METNIDFDKIRKLSRKHRPDVVSPVGIIATMISIRESTRPYAYKWARRNKSNNWLRMHGLPMRRRGL